MEEVDNVLHAPETAPPSTGNRKRRRSPLESHPENPKMWPCFENIYPLVVQSILEQSVFGVEDPMTQKLIDLTKSADCIKITIPKRADPEDRAAGGPGETSVQQSSSGETLVNEEASGQVQQMRGFEELVQTSKSMPPVVQLLADGSLTGAFDEALDDAPAYALNTVDRSSGIRLPKDHSTADLSAHEAHHEPASLPLEPIGYESIEDFEVPDITTDFEVIRRDQETVFDMQEPQTKRWEDSIEGWRDFDESFEENAFELAPKLNLETDYSAPVREDALFWGTVSGGAEDVLGIEEQYKSVARAETVSKEEAFAVNTLGWEFRCKSVIPGCKGVGRKELSTIRYEDVKKAYTAEVRTEEGSAPAGDDDSALLLKPDSAYRLLAANNDRYDGVRRNRRQGDMASFLAASVANIERMVGNSESVNTTMSILRHMMTEPTENGTRVYDVTKILNPNPPLLRSVVMDMNVYELKDENQAAGKAVALHAYQTLIPLVARYLSRPEPPSGSHRDSVPPHKRIKRAPNEENLPIRHPESVNMLQICKFITEHLLRDYSLWQIWGEILSMDGTAHGAAMDADASKLHQRWNTVSRILTSMAGGASEFAKPNEMIMSWLRAHRSITDPLSHTAETWNLSVQEAMRDMPLHWITPTNDEVYLTMDPYRPVHRGGVGGSAGSRRDLATAKAKALVHAPIAWSFPGIMPKMTSINLIRHFRPDFRTGLFHARYFVHEGIPYAALPAGRANVHKSRMAAISKLSREGEAFSAASAASGAASENSGGAGAASGGGQQLSSLWGTWTVRYPAESVCLTDYNMRLSGSGGGAGEVGQANSVHPAEVLQSTESLSMGEWCPMVLMEHTSEPQILPLAGMVGKIVRFYRPGKELYASAAQAETKLGGRLGHFGSLKILGDKQPQLFGCPLRIKPNQGISIMKTTVYAGICLVHPFDPRRPLPTPEEWLKARVRSKRPSCSREGLSTLCQQDLDFRLTDFIMIRTTSYSNSSNSRVKVTLRPLFYGYGQAGLGAPGPGALLYGIREQVGLAMESYARTGVYTLGQLAPMTEIPSPDGKRINEWRKLWVEAYSLRQSSVHDTGDFISNKNKCIRWFQGIFDNQIIQKIIIQLKNSIEENTSISFEKYLQCNRIKIVSDEIIQKIITPEQICGIISSQYGSVRLIISGIRYLRTYDRLPIARTIIQQRDFTSDAQWARLYAIFTRWLQAAAGVAGSSGSLSGLTSSSLFRLPPPFRGLNGGMRIQMSIIARMIEELIMQSPWNQWKSYQEITIKKNAQFLINCVFDDISMGRGENICFLKEDINQQCIRDSIIPVIQKYIPDTFRQLPITRYGIDPTRLIIFEDNKRNVINEINSKTLQTLLLRSGISPNDVAAMSRAELINAVFRFNFAITPPARGGAAGGLAAAATGRLDAGDYYSKINDIINRNKNTFQSDNVPTRKDKDLTDVFDDAAAASAGGPSGAAPAADQHHLEQDLELTLTSALHADRAAGSSLENQLEHELDLLSAAKDEPARPELQPCTHEQLTDSVWALSAILAPEARLGAGPPMGLVTREEGDKFEKELLAHQAADNNAVVFPPSNAVNGAALTAWIKGLPEGEVKEILQAKQSTAVPCVRWIRRVPTIAPATGGRIVNRDKVVLIFGTQNIQKFLDWRRRRLAAKFCESAPADTSLNTGGSSVTKRQAGSSAGAPASSTGRRAGNRTDVSIVKKMMGAGATGVSPAATPALKRPVPPPQQQQQSAPPSAPAVVPAVKGGDSQAGSAEEYNGGDDGPAVDESSLVAREIRGCLPVTSVRLTTRQQRLLQERVEGGTGGMVQFSGTPSQAAEELNYNLGRLITSLKKPEKKFLWFWDRVNEKDAPNYYTIVKTPMWLNCIQQKCTQKEYKTVKEFENDVQLIHSNCFSYNPDGHWIRPLAEQLVRAVQQKLRYQRLWLEEVQQHVPGSGGCQVESSTS